MSKVKIATADLETDPFKLNRIPKAFDAGFFDGKNHYEFWGEDCCQQLVEKCLWNWKGKVYFHNGGKFDFHFLMKYLPDEVEIFILNSRMLRIKFRDCILLDSYAILPVPLKASGEKDEIEYWKFEEKVSDLSGLDEVCFYRDYEQAIEEGKIIPVDNSPRELYKREIQKYRRQDNVALYDLVNAFIDEYGCGLTLANRSFNELKKLNLKPTYGSKSHDNRLRPFYYGGRVECFKTGIFKGDFKVVDINSAYPYAMTFPHFWGNEYLQLEVLPRKRVENCFIHLECESLGALPLRNKQGSLTFPHGRNEFKITGWEYLAGLETGTIKSPKIISCLVPYNVKDFRPFVEKFFAKKLEAEKRKDNNGRLFAKLLLNSAYGKFALNPEHFKEHKMLPIGENPNESDLLEKYEFYESNEDRLDDEERIEFIELEKEIWHLDACFDDWGFAIWKRKVADEDHRYYNVGTAASITGFVRAYLWRAIKKVDTPIYCDTDSIIYSGRSELNLSDKIGEWDLEAEGDSVAVGGKKLYSFRKYEGEFKIASKGVRISPLDIYKVAGGETIIWENIAPSYSVKSAPKFIKRKITKT